MEVYNSYDHKMCQILQKWSQEHMTWTGSEMWMFWKSLYLLVKDTLSKFRFDVLENKIFLKEDTAPKSNFHSNKTSLYLTLLSC